MKILGIESSCDDTACAVLEDGKILSNVISTQLEHIEFGGVIPEIASRAHLKNVIKVIDESLLQANTTLDEIDAVSVTYGPGLIGPLLVGLNAAKGISFSKKIPLIPVNHIQSHIFANFIEHNEKLKPPFVVLVVSGGHTELIHVKDYYHYELIGKTLDDAAGECLDKVSKMLGLGFPGGRIIDEHAKNGNPKFHHFTRAVKQSFDFSFSGLKTGVKVYLEKNGKEFVKENFDDIIASFLESVVDSLTDKLIKAAKYKKVKRVAIAGGVSANSRLRMKLGQKAKSENIDFFHPSVKYCTDNGAMVAMAGYKKWMTADENTRKGFSDSLNIDAIPNLRLID